MFARVFYKGKMVNVIEATDENFYRRNGSYYRNATIGGNEYRLYYSLGNLYAIKC